MNEQVSDGVFRETVVVAGEKALDAGGALIGGCG